jgi:hypothetical protein
VNDEGKSGFLAAYGSKAHIDHAFRISNNPDTYAQKHALSQNPLVTREHVLLGMKSEHPYVRKIAYTHPLATDDELKIGLSKIPIDASSRWPYERELKRRELVRQGKNRYDSS